VAHLHRPLLRAARALFSALLLLGVMAQPVLSAVQDLHEWEHVQVDSTRDADTANAEKAPNQGSLAGLLDGLLHAFDCCLHATALTGTGPLWTPNILRSRPPLTPLPPAAPSPLSRFLRPPIAA